MRFSARPPKPILPNTGNINHFVDGGSQNFTVVSIMLRCTCQELELNTVTRQVETYESLREKWSAELSKLKTEHAQKQHVISDLEHSLEECSKQPQNQQVQTSVYILLLIFGRHANIKGANLETRQRAANIVTEKPQNLACKSGQKTFHSLDKLVQNTQIAYISPFSYK